MNHDDYIDWLTEQVMATAELLGGELKPTAASIMAEDLSFYPPDVMKKALRRVRAEHAGKLTLKVIIDRIDEAVGRPSPNEAWATASQALDESKTIVWTDEMAQAWGAASPLAYAGDMIGARMAFLAAYERLVRDSREARRLPVVSISEGWDQAGRAVAVEKAARLGYVKPEQAVAYLPTPEPVFNAVALLQGRVEVAAVAPPDVRERLRQLRDDLARSAGVYESQRIAQRDREARELQRRKDDVAQRVADYVAGVAKGAA